jgi:hypothetical protein
LPRPWRNKGVSINTTAKLVFPFHDEEEHQELRDLLRKLTEAIED